MHELMLFLCAAKGLNTNIKLLVLKIAFQFGSEAGLNSVFAPF
jgi:hypothetical protein